ncbi:MAG: hypothetical protein MRZ42_05115 [Tenericutes bacterium]|nr:hypothetical protein [Mycoplasmatota bacterium]
MKKLNKIIFYSIFLTFLIITNGDNVYADVAWPGVDSSQIPSNYKGMEYCVYTTQNVYLDSSGFEKLSKWYSNKSYILIHDSKNNEIKFLDKKGTVVTTASEYAWATGGINQCIYFSQNLYNYLVPNGELQCKKLYFYERKKGSNLLSTSGSLKILTDVSEYFGANYNSEDYAVQILQQTGVEGTRYGENWCKVNYEKLKAITEPYYSQIDSINNAYYQMSKQKEYQIGDAKKGKEYLASAKALNENARNAIADLHLNDQNSDVNVSNCDATFNNEYQKIIQNLESVLKQFSTYQRTINSKLTSAKNSGKITEEEYKKEKEEMDGLKTETDTALEEWEEYRKNINFGKKIEDAGCEGLLGKDLLDDISQVLTWVRIAVPILVILLGSTDFARAVLSDDQQELKKATSRFAKRCIIAVAIFFIPSIIMYLLSFIDKIYDVSCDIRLW